MNRSNEILDLMDRIRAELSGKEVCEKRMFGGVTFMLNGNMLCCISKKGLMVRVGKELEAEALSRPFAERCLGTGRPMSGFIIVAFAGLENDNDLSGWLNLARTYVETLLRKTLSP